MAEEDRTSLTPERVFARNFVAHFRLVPPVNIESLVGRFADVEHDALPRNWDALVVRKPGNRPLIIVSTSTRETRLRFTLAHELGHIVLPWQFGSAFCHPDERTLVTSSDRYARSESEANRFASDILIPREWLRTRLHVTKSKSLADSMVSLASQAGVSPIALTIAMEDSCPFPAAAWVTKPDGSTGYVVRSQTCLLSQDARWYEDLAELKSIGGVISVASLGAYTLHAVAFPERSQPVATSDKRASKDILDTIFASVPVATSTLLRQRLNGILGYANNMARRGNGTRDILHYLQSRCAGRADLRVITRHELFSDFLNAKARELSAKIG